MVKDGNDRDDDDECDKYDDNKEDIMDVQTPLVSCRVEYLKRLNMDREREREGNGTISGRESGAGDEIFRFLQASIQGERKRCRQTFG